MTAPVIAHYTAYRTRQPLGIDGRLDKRAWQLAPKTPRFVDMANGDLALFDSRAAALWDDQNLYIAYWCEEPFPQATLTQRDDMVCRESDVEVFFDGGDCYYEFEINALGTIYEVFFIWQDAFRHGSRFDVPEFDLLGRKAVSFGGNDDRSGPTFWYGSHPRGPRWAFLDWDFPGIRTAVQVDGVLNNRKVLSKGWSVELAFPWEGMKWLANGKSLPPKDGDTWRIMFSRFENLYISGHQAGGQAGWVLSPHGVNDSHRPEFFPYVHMSSTCVEDLDLSFPRNRESICVSTRCGVRWLATAFTAQACETSTGLDVRRPRRAPSPLQTPVEGKLGRSNTTANLTIPIN